MSVFKSARAALLLLAMSLAAGAGATIRYVKPTATGTGNGSSWANASANLQGMINASLSGDEVWVAAGTYLPTEDYSGSTSPTDPRTRTFHLPVGIKLYGGFAGTESSTAARNISLNTTTLSGDLGVPSSGSDNSYHVVSSFLPNFSFNYDGFTLDGFSVKYGLANGGVGQDYGGGIYVLRASGVVLRNLQVAYNAASGNGGGIYAGGVTGTLSLDSIYSNSSQFGGGLHSDGDALVVDSSAIYLNTAGTGGGITLRNGSGTVNHCAVYSNTASGSVGGGLYLSLSPTCICTNNTIFNNSANNYWGGGLYYSGGNWGVITAYNNCFYGNSAQAGGAIHHNDGTGNYSNNTFYNNSSSGEGGALYKLGGSANFRNNIFWLNKRSNSTTVAGADIVITSLTTNSYYNNLLQFSSNSYSLGSSAGGNFYGLNPAFVNPSLPLGADGLPGTADDGLALSPCSPLINTGITLNPAVPTDIAGSGRVGAYDIGAYEFQGTLPLLAGAMSVDSMLCLGSTLALTNTVPGGSWSSSNTAIATVSSTGVVSGVALGTATISYTLGTTGCPGTVATRNVTVSSYVSLNPSTGPASACTSQPIQLSNATAGGVWTSSSPALATVSNTGVVTGLSSGAVQIVYTTGGPGCSNSVSKTITVNATPVVNPISGDTWVCLFGTPQYSSTTTGGVWSTASNGAKSTIAANGALTPVATGQDTVFYTVTSAQGCQQRVMKQIVIVTVPAAFNSLPGPSTVCATKSIQLTNAFYGGVWSSSNTAVATVSSQGLVTGVSAGPAVISYVYTNPSYGCTSTTTKTITVVAFTGAGTITGGSAICAGGSLQLSNGVSGGTWSTASGGAKSTVSSTGLVLPVLVGSTDTVRYIVTSSNGCADTASRIIAISAYPVVAAIQGPDSLCANSSALYTNATAGGSWSSAMASIASVSPGGSVTGLSGGPATITYTVTNTAGCATPVSKQVYVKTAPVVASITGASTLCAGSTIQYSNSTAGGQWSTASGGATTAISATGLLTAGGAGTDTVRYTLTNASGCSSVVRLAVTVNAPQLLPIAGATDLCIGASLQLSHPVAGGVWTNFNAVLGSVTSTGGFYTAMAPGTDTVYYQYTSNGCPAKVAAPLTNVQQIPALISGSPTLCKGSTQVLTASLPDGTWSSGNSTVASVNGAGVVTGISSGAASIRYTLTNALGCSATSAQIVTVNEALVSTSQNGAVLTATGNQSGATYQWVRCGAAYQPVPGAVAPVYTALSNGQYAVVVTYQGCRDTSACLSVTSLGVETVAATGGVQVFYLDDARLKVVTGERVPVSMKLFDAQGRLVKELRPNSAETLVDASDLAKGVYLLHCYFRDGKTVSKVNVR